MDATEKLDLTILVVDDEESIRHGITTFFKKKNFTVYAQENYLSAVEVAKILINQRRPVIFQLPERLSSLKSRSADCKYHPGGIKWLITWVNSGQREI